MLGAVQEAQAAAAPEARGYRGAEDYPADELQRGCTPAESTIFTDRPLGGAAKRAFDVLAATALLIFVLPLLLLLAAAVCMESSGPALYKQARGGFAGRTFRIWKLRTMRVCEGDQAVVQARRVDPRVTPLGGFLRRTSLDELPQLVNVLIGDMSIVGPRPHALRHDEEFAALDPSYRQRRQARPGITGLAQISGCRGPTDCPERVLARTRYDIEYVRSWSFRRDLGILLRTALVIWDDPDAI